MKTIILILFVFLCTLNLFPQDIIKGEVYGLEKNKKVPLATAGIFWKGTSNGTITDENGKFTIERNDNSNILICSYLGFKNDTISIVDKQNFVKFILQSTLTLEEVEVKERTESSYISKMETIHTQKIDGCELKKAACCNLSESFETNASVDVHYSDALTGAKQIQLLGLAGVYSQIMTEKVPHVRGLSTPYGLGYIPGSWMESIQISKGTSSVESGFESITGQINVEYKKPDSKEIFYFNALGSNKGKAEFNTNGRIKLNDKWSTMILLHGENFKEKHDANNDGFMDHPMMDQINVLNRWKYTSEKLSAQFGVKYLRENRYGGQLSYNDNLPASTENGYGIVINSERAELFHKTGVFFKRELTSLAIIQSGSYYDQTSLFGLRTYKGTQKSYSGNMIFQSFLKNEDHTIRTGFSYIYDHFNEEIDQTVYLREEHIPGAYFQYTFSKSNIFNAIAGIRSDYSSIYGLFFTPRVHAKYNISENLTVRASAGKGYRSANIFAENSYVMASSRTIQIIGDLDMEEAWNYGLSVSQDVKIGSKKLKLNGEFYRTDFINQVVVDMDADITKIKFYNLDGRSFSNSCQFESSIELIKRLDLTAAIRFSDVRMTIDSKLQEKPLVNRYKGLFTVSYATKLKKWQFDFTTQFNGDGRMPSTVQNPTEYRKPEIFPAYIVMNAQITKYFKKWNIYTGVENLTGYTQKDPIIAAADPYGDYFDASMVWGPLVGRKFYLGIRYIIEE